MTEDIENPDFLGIRQSQISWCPGFDSLSPHFYNMKVYCTYCSENKSKKMGKIPSIERYNSSRINLIYEKSKKDKVPFVILSGKFGLLSPEEEIEWYDQKLNLSQSEELSEIVKNQIEKQKIKHFVFFLKSEDLEAKKYEKFLKIICDSLGIKTSVKLI